MLDGYMFDIYLRMINTKNNFYKSLLLMFKELLPLGSSKLKFKHFPNFNEIEHTKFWAFVSKFGAKSSEFVQICKSTTFQWTFFGIKLQFYTSLISYQYYTEKEEKVWDQILISKTISLV